MKNRLRVRRAELEGLSQQDAATKAGLTRDRYWRIEKGYTEPTARECQQLATALDTTVHGVFPELAAIYPNFEAALVEELDQLAAAGGRP